jgi:hypothetical protein
MSMEKAFAQRVNLTLRRFAQALGAFCVGYMQACSGG